MENTDRSIEERLASIENKLDYIIGKNRKVEEHIDFIESVYSTLKKPLSYISTKFGGNELEDKK